MCSIDTHGKENQSDNDDGISGGGYTLPSNSTTEVLVLLSAIINFIGCWLKALEHNYLYRSHMHIFSMKLFFLKYQLNS